MKKLFLAACLGSLATLVPVPAATLLNDTFDAAHLSGSVGTDVYTVSAQSLPNSAYWWNSTVASGTSAADYNLVYSATTSPAGMTLRKTTAPGGTFNVMAYLTDSRSSFITLGVGDSLSLTFDITAINPLDKSFGLFVGLLNSHGSQVTDNYYQGTNKGQTTGFDGYIVKTNLGTSVSSNRTFGLHRNPGIDYSLYAGATTTDLGNSGGVNLTSGTTYQGSMTVTRDSATQTSLDFSLNGVTLSTTDTSGLNTFDVVNFGYQYDASDALTFDNILVTTTVPEPSAALLLLTGIGTLFMVRRGRA